jgi:hypothetical protein
MLDKLQEEGLFKYLSGQRYDLTYPGINVAKKLKEQGVKQDKPIPGNVG